MIKRGLGQVFFLKKVAFVKNNWLNLDEKEFFRL